MGDWQCDCGGDALKRSVIINTACLGDTTTRNSQKMALHASRLYALRHWIIPSYLNNKYVDELIVVGEYEAGDGYRYVSVPSVHKTCVDALAQRQAGFEAATGDWLVFQHDDHVLDEWFGLDARADVLSPMRVRTGVGRLNNGEAAFNPSPYISGHCAVYKRAVLEACPWGAVPPQHTWDCAHTAQIRAAGFTINWTDAMRIRDVES